MSRIDPVRVSKAMSYLLRHGALKEQVPIQDDGKMKMSDLVSWLQSEGHHLTSDTVVDIVKTNAKQRYSYDPASDMIWAAQGHTMQMSVQMVPWTGQGPLVHASYMDVMESIQADGLNRMERQHIHMIDPIAPGCWSLVRSNANMFVLIDAAKARESYGISFQMSDNGVVLSEGLHGTIPTDCLTCVPAPRKTPCYGFLVQTADGQSVATVQTLQIDRPGNLGFPKGKVHKGEHALACALRELKEETGLSPVQLRVTPYSYEEYNEKGNCPTVYFHAFLVEKEQPPLVRHNKAEGLIGRWVDKNSLRARLKTSLRKVLESAVDF